MASPKKHRNVSGELSRSLILWRYLDLAKFMDLLENSSLYLTRADKFEDKFEGSFTKSIKKLIEMSYQENNIDFTYEQFKSGLRKGVFVNCWHQGTKESMAMWRLYGKSSNAVAITTTVGKLANELQVHNRNNNISIKKVEYIDHFDDPKIDVSKYTNIFAYKNDAYSFENEVRIIADHYPNPAVMGVDSSGYSLEVKLSNLLRSIVVSPESPEWFFNLINQICTKYKCSNFVQRSKLANGPI